MHFSTSSRRNEIGPSIILEIRAIDMRTVYILSTAIITLGLLSSCNREGCSNEDAMNYDSKARLDDGSCQYQGQGVIWWPQGVSDNMEEDGLKEVNEHVDGQFIQTEMANEFWPSQPDCSNGTAVSFTQDKGIMFLIRHGTRTRGLWLEQGR